MEGKNQTLSLSFLAFDRIAFAHDLTETDYKYATENKGYGIYGNTPENGGVLEVGFVEETPLVLTINGTEILYPEDSIFIIPPNTPFSVRTEGNGVHRHNSAEFLISARPAGEGEDGHLLELPLILKPSADNSEIISIIKRIADAKIANLHQTYFEECELFMRLIRRLSDRANDSRGEKGGTPANRYLCKRVKTYISGHLSEQIRVGDIAASIGVSKNYLTTVFSKTEGMPLTEYINKLRLAHLTDLVRKYGYSLSEAGEQVGFSDANYLSRIFKKYTGMTFTEFINL